MLFYNTFIISNVKNKPLSIGNLWEVFTSVVLRWVFFSLFKSIDIIYDLLNHYWECLGGVLKGVLLCGIKTYRGSLGYVGYHSWVADGRVGCTTPFSTRSVGTASQKWQMLQSVLFTLIKLYVIWTKHRLVIWHIIELNQHWLKSRRLCGYVSKN